MHLSPTCILAIARKMCCCSGCQRTVRLGRKAKAEYLPTCMNRMAREERDATHRKDEMVLLNENL